MRIARPALTVVAIATILVALALGGAAGRPAAAQTYFALVGTYTNQTGSQGIYLYEFDAEAGKLTTKGLAAETRDPSWLVVHSSGKFVYAANESGKQSAVSAFALDARSGKLSFLNQLPALGEDPCYLSVDNTGKYLFVANYTSGNVVVFPILPDGKLGGHTALVTDAGPLGPNKQRQEGPHAHWIENLGGEVFVADLGLDRVMVYRFDPAKGALEQMPAVGPRDPFPQGPVELDAGTGPRHVAFSRSGRIMYVLGELDSTVTRFVVTKEGVFNHGLAKYTMLPSGFRGRNDAAEIEIHPNGRFLYASNRGHDSIAVYAIDQDYWGRLTEIGDFPTGGKDPRHFAIDPTGRFLLAENQHSNSIVVFSIDAATGALKEVSRTEGVASPVCLVFLPKP